MFEEIFKYKKAEFAAIEDFGFVKTESGYIWSKDILGGTFELRVLIDKSGAIKSNVIDKDTREMYVLYQAVNAEGAFIGKMREECRRILQEIADRCYVSQIFKSTVTQQVIAYVQQKYHDKLEFLWEKFPDNAVFRRSDNKKWYAAILTVMASKLNLENDRKFEVIDLRGTPENIVVWVDGIRYFPGYHMNKKNWYTICLDGSVDVAEIFWRIDESYRLAKK